MEQFKQPSPLSREGNLSKNWKCWRQHFELYVKATKADPKGDKIRVAIFLHCIGEGALEVFNSFEFPCDEDNKKVDEVLQKFATIVVRRRKLYFNGSRFGTKANKREKQSINLSWSSRE